MVNAASPNADTQPTEAWITVSPATIQEGRATCLQNKFHQPALDISLNWKTTQQECEATEATKAAKKVENKCKKAEKVKCIHLHKSGTACITHLEEAREQCNHEEDAHLNMSGTRHTYLALHRAGGDRNLSMHGGAQDGGSEKSGSEFKDNKVSCSSEDSLDEEEEDKVDKEDKDKSSSKLPVKKVCISHHFWEVKLQALLTLFFAFQKAKTNTEHKGEK